MKDTIYEVNITVENATAEAYRSWLDGHIREILSLPGFTDAELFKRESEADKEVATTHQCWSVHYHSRSRADLENYFRNHAPRLRKEAVDRFGNRFKASRRILEPLVRF